MKNDASPSNYQYHGSDQLTAFDSLLINSQGSREDCR
jgi:hypothetical protein